MTHRTRVGPVSKSKKKKLPFYKNSKGRVCFNPRVGVNIDHGIMFDEQRGHRVYFNYHDTPELKNTWGTESLRRYIKNNFMNVNDEMRQAAKLYLACCDLADDMQRRWEAAGKPPEGVPEYEGKKS